MIYTKTPLILMISMYFLSLTHVWMNALGVSMDVKSPFSLALMMLVGKTDYVLPVEELASSLGMYIRFLLTPRTVCHLILPSCLWLRNIFNYNTIWRSSYVRSHSNKRVHLVQMIYLALGCWLVLVYPLFQTCLEWKLSHDYSHGVGFGLVEIFLRKHMSVITEHYRDLCCVMEYS